MEYSEEIFNSLSIVILSGKGVQRCHQSPHEKKETDRTSLAEEI
nr:unnamed protein product [Callosobruchus chinensis]